MRSLGGTRTLTPSQTLAPEASTSTKFRHETLELGVNDGTRTRFLLGHDQKHRPLLLRSQLP